MTLGKKIELTSNNLVRLDSSYSQVLAGKRICTFFEQTRLNFLWENNYFGLNEPAAIAEINLGGGGGGGQVSINGEKSDILKDKKLWNNLFTC